MAGSRGFTLIELVITVAIVAILASMAVPLTEMAVKRSKEQDLQRALREIREAIDGYKKTSDEGKIKKDVDASGYPKSLEELAQGVEDAKSPERRVIYFLRRIPRDPMNGDASLSAAETWGKRAYESPPDNPWEGSDVFDVYSLSEDVGMNGILYREW
ncbi:MAG: type II secretion system protein [Burkholderiales bacterium]